MALQGSGGLGGVLSQFFFQSLFTQSLRSFVSAQIELNTEPFNPGRFFAESGIKSRLANLGAVSNVDSQVKAELDVAATTLSSVSTQLSELATLATSALGSSTSQRQELQASALALSGAIQSSLATAISSDPNLRVPVTITPGAGSQGVIANVNVSSLTANIGAEGLDFSFRIDNGENRGERATIDDAIQTTGGVLTGAGDVVQFTLSGSLGSVDFTFNTGDSVSTVIEAINNAQSSTGITAEEGTTSDDITFNSVEYGSSAVTNFTILQNDAGAGVTFSGTTSDTGANVSGELYVDGTPVTIDSDGRTISFDYQGVKGEIQLYTESLADGDPGANLEVDFTVYNGGKALIGSNGELFQRVGLSAFDFGSLGRSAGGLGSIDLVNDPGEAIRIIAAAQEDLATSEVRADFASNSFLGPRLTANADQIGALNEALDELSSVSEAIGLFDRVRAESRASTSLSLISQLSGLFPASAVGLL